MFPSSFEKINKHNYQYQIKSIARNATMKECVQYTKDLGIHCRYRSKIEYVKIIVSLRTRSKISSQDEKALRDYILYDAEISNLCHLYSGKGTTVARNRAVRSISSVLYAKHLRGALDRCGVVTRFRTKEAMLDILCHIWFRFQSMFVEDEILPAGTECTICMEQVRTGDNKRPLCQCKYSYHKSCLDKWYRTTSTCPTCRI